VRAGGAAAVDEDTLKELRVWTLRARRNRDGLDREERSTVRKLLQGTRALGRSSPDEELDRALLELAGVRWLPGQRTEDGRESARILADWAETELRARLVAAPEDFGTWLAETILAADGRATGASRSMERERKIVAARLLAGRHLAPTRGMLLVTARSESTELREAALDALAGWPDPVVHQFFFEALEESGKGIHDLARHLELVGDELGPGARDRLRLLCGRLYLDGEWRRAARAGKLVGNLATDEAVPILMEALAVWHRRAEEGGGSRRILGEIVRELQRLSGRSIGDEPDRWRRWWQAVEEGRVDLPADLEEKGQLVSSASFFGLRAATENVVFVIDRSGSMDGVFTTDGRTRYQEAIEQFLRFLEQAGEKTRFALVLFSDDGDRWHSGLVRATGANLEQAHEWLDRNGPEGGTRLFEGLRAALRLDRRGRLSPERLEADTVIVLCDGATDEGPEWVRPWLRRENEVAQVVFHCVEIGHRGKGTLEALAAGSGGDFIRVGR
jgi:Mg-chelatase subunit ChlD